MLGKQTWAALHTGNHPGVEAGRKLGAEMPRSGDLSIKERLPEPPVVDDRTRAERVTEQRLVNPSEHPAQDGEAERSISIPGRPQGVSKPAGLCHRTERKLPPASPFHDAGL